jgi:aryl-alcohol dehydrogenase-like predicted oxidoreductase
MTENIPEHNSHPTVPLGKSGLNISPLGLGAWAWGDRVFWGYGRGYQEQDVAQAFQVSLQGGVNWIDSAEVYGLGTSERLLGRFIKELDGVGPDVVVATKFFPFPWQWRRGALKGAVQRSLKRLDLPAVDLYQVHFPRPDFLLELYAGDLAEVVQQGLARAVGVSNYSAEQMQRTQRVLEKHGLPLASNQVHYSLLHRDVERNGVLQTCRELGVTLIAYSPLEMGLLSGKYTPENPPPGVRGQRYSPQLLREIQPLVKVLAETGARHGGKTPAQVALNWLISKGTVPIPGAKNARQAADNAGALGWKLDEAEIQQLDELSERIGRAQS